MTILTMFITLYLLLIAAVFYLVFRTMASTMRESDEALKFSQDIRDKLL